MFSAHASQAISVDRGRLLAGEAEHPHRHVGVCCSASACCQAVAVFVHAEHEPLLPPVTERATRRSPVVARPVRAGLTRIGSDSKPVFGPENTLAHRPPAPSGPASRDFKSVQAPGCPPLEDAGPDLSRRSHLDEGGSNRGDSPSENRPVKWDGLPSCQKQV